MLIAIFGLFINVSPAQAMTCNSATLNGTVDVNATPPTSAHFEYGTSYNSVQNGQGLRTATQLFYGNGSIEQLINGLTENTTYYFRLVVTNNNGVNPLNIRDFTTPLCNNQTPTQNPTVSISADQTNLSNSGSTMIRWSSTNANSCTASNGTNGWSGNINTSGSFNTGALYNTTTYNITCTNNYGSANNSVTVYTNNNNPYPYPQNPTVSISADQVSLANMGSTTIRWYSSNANYCYGNNGSNGWSGTQSTSGVFYTGSLYNTTTYNITCTNNYGQASNSVTVYLNNYPYPNNPQAYVSISADQPSLAYMSATTIRWYPSNATYCYASGGNNNWTGSRSTSGGSFYTGPLAYTTTYTISCNNSNGVADIKSVTVNVSQGQNNTALNAITNEATLVTGTSAQLNSLVTNSSNSSANTHFEWGRTTNLGNRTNSTNIGYIASISNYDTITGLSRGTTYYFRAVAENSSWRSTGTILSFTTPGGTARPSTPTSTVVISSAVDRTQPIAVIDNTSPRPGDEINYTVNYRNIGTGSITNLSLQMVLPQEVNYMFSNPSTPNIFGNTLIFNLGTLGANGQGTVTVRVKVRDNIADGTNLNFPATLSYIDPAGVQKSVVANVTARVINDKENNVADEDVVPLGANAFFSGAFFPGTLIGLLLLIILILSGVLLVKNIFLNKHKEDDVPHAPAH